MATHIDISALRAFSVVASQLNMRRAADQLNISQPPLSRKIKTFEERLGVELFIRHSYGLELTKDGKEILEIVQPLLVMQEEVQSRLDNYKKHENCVAGFTTAFEQMIFDPVVCYLKSVYGDKLLIKRTSSLQLANEIAKDKILLAWVALPIEQLNISTIQLPYLEPLRGIIPDKWKLNKSGLNLQELNDKPFFWFPSYRNPYWHERMEKVFRKLGFKPVFIDEPLEYEVLMAQIAAGEGWSLVPKSFSAIQRQGIEYIEIRDLPPLEMGIIYKNEEGKRLAEKCMNILNAY